MLTISALCSYHSILKVGVGALDDSKKLLIDYGISMTGCVDLRHMAGRHKKSWYVYSMYLLVCIQCSPLSSNCRRPTKIVIIMKTIAIINDCITQQVLL